jgi:hypothetical protein
MAGDHQKAKPAYSLNEIGQPEGSQEVTAYRRKENGQPRLPVFSNIVTSLLSKHPIPAI